MPKTQSQPDPAQQETEATEGEPLTVDLPGFQSTPEDWNRQATGVRTPEELQAMAELAGVDEEGSASGSGDDSGRSTQTTTGSFPASTPSPGPSPALPGFEEIARTVVAVVAMGVRWVRQRTAPMALPPGLWLATEDDQEAIGGPLARITARHAPITGEGTEDVADGIAAVMGTVGYAVRNLQMEDFVRQAGPIDLPEDPQEQ